MPAHYLAAEYRRSLDAYVRDYLKEEVFDEGLTRNVPAFSRFFDAMAYSHGELTNYANIARDCGVDAKTVKEYYQILVDTLLGTFIEPYQDAAGTAGHHQGEPVLSVRCRRRRRRHEAARRRGAW